MQAGCGRRTGTVDGADDARRSRPCDRVAIRILPAIGADRIQSAEARFPGRLHAGAVEPEPAECWGAGAGVRARRTVQGIVGDAAALVLLALLRLLALANPRAAVRVLSPAGVPNVDAAKGVALELVLFPLPCARSGHPEAAQDRRRKTSRERAPRCSLPHATSQTIKSHRVHAIPRLPCLPGALNRP